MRQKARTMAEPETVLDRLLVEAFKAATREGRDDVADHVLNALECLCGGPESGGAREIYRIIGNPWGSALSPAPSPDSAGEIQFPKSRALPDRARRSG